ncbi:hypothetical protein ACOME3_000814 [Neoechinorhynchus agilis]
MCFTLCFKPKPQKPPKKEPNKKKKDPEPQPPPIKETKKQPPSLPKPKSYDETHYAAAADNLKMTESKLMNKQDFDERLKSIKCDRNHLCFLDSRTRMDVYRSVERERDLHRKHVQEYLKKRSNN